MILKNMLNGLQNLDKKVDYIFVVVFIEIKKFKILFIVIINNWFVFEK